MTKENLGFSLGCNKNKLLSSNKKIKLSLWNIISCLLNIKIVKLFSTNRNWFEHHKWHTFLLPTGIMIGILEGFKKNFSIEIVDYESSAKLYIPNYWQKQTNAGYFKTFWDEN